MKSSIHPEAEAELLLAAAYYREQGGANLALRLVADFEQADALLREFPGIGVSWRKNTRIPPLFRFPYSVIYYVKDDEIRIVAFAHQSRRKGFWRHRR